MQALGLLEIETSLKTEGIISTKIVKQSLQVHFYKQLSNMNRLLTPRSLEAGKNNSRSGVLSPRVRLSDEAEPYDSGNGHTKQVMDECISFCNWEQMPRGPMEKILCSLSLLEVLQVRSVCQTWKQIIDSPQFLSYYDQKTVEPCFVVYWEENEARGRKILGYFPLLDVWRILPRSLIQPQTGECCTRGTRSLPAPGLSTNNIPGLAQGMLCIHLNECCPYVRDSGSRLRYKKNSDIDALELSLHNPLSGWFSFLPAYPDPKLRFYPYCGAISVIVRQSQEILKVLCAGIHGHDQKEVCPGREGECVSTLLFDSASSTWMQVADLPLSGLRFRTDQNNQITRADYDSLSYYVTEKADELVLLSFSHEVGTWNIIPGRMPPQHTYYRQCHDPISLTRRRRSLILTFRTSSNSRSLFCVEELLFPQIFSWDLAASPHFQCWDEIKLLDPPVPEIPLDNLFVLLTACRWYVQGDFIFFTCSDLWGLVARTFVFNLTSKTWKVTRFVPDTLPGSALMLDDVLQLIVPLEVQLSAVLNFTAQREPTYCFGLCDDFEELGHLRFDDQFLEIVAGGPHY